MRETPIKSAPKAKAQERAEGRRGSCAALRPGAAEHVLQPCAETMTRPGQARLRRRRHRPARRARRGADQELHRRARGYRRLRPARGRERRAALRAAPRRRGKGRADRPPRRHRPIATRPRHCAGCGSICRARHCRRPSEEEYYHADLIGLGGGARRRRRRSAGCARCTISAPATRSRSSAPGGPP